jgi:nitrite reductase/ring-hydroxylating ferredoxin subunit
VDHDSWLPTIPLADLPEGRGTRVTLEGTALLLARDGDRVFALADRCTHQGAPLSHGPISLVSPASVTCPLHGSRFALDSGRVLRGPATVPVAAYDVRVNEGVVEIRDRA